jgi:hypothetical protein
MGTLRRVESHGPGSTGHFSGWYHPGELVVGLGLVTARSPGSWSLSG